LPKLLTRQCQLDRIAISWAFLAEPGDFAKALGDAVMQQGAWHLR